jgi:lambda family phage portal protein
MKLRARIANAMNGLLGRSFDAASGGNRWPQWASMWAPARQQLMARHQLYARAGYLISNSPSAASVADVWTSSLVGDGPSVRSGHPNEAIRGALEDGWARFYEDCDQEGVADLGGMLSGATRSTVASGDGLLHFVTTPRGELRLRLLSPEQLDPSRTRELEDMTRIIAGVEFDATGRRTAYHIFPQQPDLIVNMQWAPTRIPAEDIIHIFRADVPGQVRGTSWLTPVLTLLMELDRLQDALLARANTAALFGGFVTDPSGTSGFGDGKVDPQQLSLEPGVLRILPPDATITFPAMPSADDMPDLMRHLLRQIAAGVGVPYELLAGDLSQVNYSSAKLGLEAFKRRVGAIRTSLLGARVLRPIWRRFVTLEVLSGRLYAPNFESNPEPYFAMTAMWPGFAPLDPYREAEADVLLMQNGLASRQEIIERRGRDFAAVDAEIANDSFRPTPPRPTNPALMIGDSTNAA